MTMKNAKAAFLFLLTVPTLLYSQSGSINNTLGDGGTFTIRDGSTTFLSLSQSTGGLSLSNCLALPFTTSSTLGVIWKNNDRFIHDYRDPGASGYNTFVGMGSGNFTMSSAAISNTAVGTYALTSLTSGSANSAFGYNSLYYNNTGGTNSAFGSFALWKNESGDHNCAFGYNSLGANTSGSPNSAFGSSALMSNTLGSYNCAFGDHSLQTNTTGIENSGFGYQSLYSCTGDSNTAIGYQAGSSLTTGSNNTCIGFNAQVPSATSGNQVQIGDANVTYAGVQVAWTITSDRRLKSKIAPSSLGLGFVSKLRPVSYTRTNDEKQRSEYGFIAQEIEEVLKEEGVENAGMLTVDEKGVYELRYNDLLAPMVKAIQELKNENDALKNELVALRASIAEQVKNEVKAAFLKAVQQEDATTKVSLNETNN
jgi:hypothetical protein